MLACADALREAGARTETVVAGSDAEIDAVLARFDGVRGVSHEIDARGGTELTILCTDTAPTLDRALALLRGYGATIGAVRIVEPTLEDAFLAIAGRTFE